MINANQFKRISEIHRRLTPNLLPPSGEAGLIDPSIVKGTDHPRKKGIAVRGEVFTIPDDDAAEDSVVDINIVIGSATSKKRGRPRKAITQGEEITSTPINDSWKGLRDLHEIRLDPLLDRLMKGSRNPSRNLMTM